MPDRMSLLEFSSPDQHCPSKCSIVQSTFVHLQLLNMFVLVPRMRHNNCVTPCPRPSFCKQVNAHLCHKHRINLHIYCQPVVTTHIFVCSSFSVGVMINNSGKFAPFPVFAENLSIVLTFQPTNQQLQVQKSLEIAGYLALPPTHSCLKTFHIKWPAGLCVKQL